MSFSLVFFVKTRFVWLINGGIERKMRTLEDCGRLRDIIEGLPSDRHFVPSVLFISWTNTKENVLDDDLLAMVRVRFQFFGSKRDAHGPLVLRHKDMSQRRSLKAMARSL